MERKWSDPEQIAEEYRRGINFKAGLGQIGLYAQAKKNERFFCGDQWHGAKCGDRPLLQHNVIKRIGDYKMAVVGSASIAVSYSADGVPFTEASRHTIEQERELLTQDAAAAESRLAAMSESDRINLIMGALSDYFRTTAERLKFDDKKTAVLRNAYITGTGVLYTYWDERTKTGLYADERREMPITGDIACEVLPIENVYFGDPNSEALQDQPYILLAQRRRVEDIRREMRRQRRPQAEIDAVVPESDKGYEAGDRSENEPAEAGKAVCITKLYKQWDDEGQDYRVMAVVTCGKATVRRPWDLRLRLYPLAVMRWEQRASCAYGDSEITNLIPNQIAINRANTAAAWAVMTTGMPIMTVNRDIVPGPITNDPGQIVDLYAGDSGAADTAIRYSRPPDFSPQFHSLIDNLIQNTLSQSGANDAALGNMRPENTSAIIAVRDAATMPMQMLQNRFYSFVEDVARVWAEYWVTMYGKRQLRISDQSGDWYMPFDGEQCRDLLINTRVDVGAAGVWSESQTIATLDNLLQAGLLDALQYLKRVPNGIIPDKQGLIRETQQKLEQAAMQAQQPATQPEPADAVAALPEEYQAAYDALTPEQQAEALAMSEQ